MVLSKKNNVFLQCANCGLIMYLLLAIGPCEVFSNSHCVMYGFCGENDYGTATCSYNGTALALDDKHALEILQSICPDVLRESNLLCCSAEQVVQINNEMEMHANLGLSKCPSCLSNYRKMLCEFACSSKQSDFLKVSEYDFSDEGDLIIETVSYYMSRQYADGMFDSCKAVQGLTPGSTVVDLLCGGWGKDCTVERWLNFLGSTPKNNGFSPFEINFHLSSDSYIIVDGEKFIPMNENTTLCSESPYPGAENCTCLNCEEACKLNITAAPPLLPDEPHPWIMIDANGILVTCLRVFCLVSAFLFLVYFCLKMQCRKLMRFIPN